MKNEKYELEIWICSEETWDEIRMFILINFIKISAKITVRPIIFEYIYICMYRLHH